VLQTRSDLGWEIEVVPACRPANVPLFSCGRISKPRGGGWRQTSPWYFTTGERESGAGHDDLRPSVFNGFLGDLAPHIRMCDNSHMATNLAIDDRLLEEARRIGGQKTKRATVTEALSEYIQRRKQQQIVELFGKLDVDPGYDYKKQRRRK
jgi:hypothetical protein